MTLPDALGALTHRLLTERPWIVVPALLWWALSMLGVVAKPTYSAAGGLALAMVAAALGFTLRRAPTRGRVATVVLCLLLLLAAPRLRLLTRDLGFAATFLLPLAMGATLRLRGWAVVLPTTTVGGLLFLLPPIDPYGPPAAAHAALPILVDLGPWLGGALCVCGVVGALRSRSRWMTLLAVAVPPAALTWSHGWPAAREIHPSVAVACLIGLAGRVESPGSDVLGRLVAAVRRRVGVAGLMGGFVLAWLVPDIDLTATRIGGTIERAAPAVPGFELAAVGVGLVCICVPLMAAVRGSVFERLATPPLIAIGIVAGLFADPAAIEWATGGWGHESISFAARSLLVLFGPVLLGVGLALLTRWAGPVVLAALLGVSIWAAYAGRTDVPADALLWAGVGLAMGWGAASRATTVELTTLLIAGSLVGLFTVADLGPARDPEPWIEFGARGWGLDGSPSSDALLEGLEQCVAVAIGALVVVHAIRLARVAFSTCPLPEWHPVRSDFDGEPRAPAPAN